MNSESEQLVTPRVKLNPARIEQQPRDQKSVDKPAPNRDYQIMNLNNYKYLNIAKRRRMIVLPVWQTLLRPVVRSRF